MNWYGREKGEPWEQRWTGFKALVQRLSPQAARDPNEFVLDWGPHSLLVGSPKKVKLSAPIEPIGALSGSGVSDAQTDYWSDYAKKGKSKTVSAYSRYKVLPVPSWHLDSAEADPCWMFDPSALPISDWSARNKLATNATTREVFSLLHVEVDRALGVRYASGYEEAQIAVKLVDWLVKSTGCPALLRNPEDSVAGKWFIDKKDTTSWHAERWKHIFDVGTLNRVGPQVFRAVQEEALLMTDPDYRLEDGRKYRNEGRQYYPFECLAAQQFRILCRGAIGEDEAVDY